jgi:hypothetical protein
LLTRNLCYFAAGGHSSLLAVHHHQFVHGILKLVVCMKFIIFPIEGGRKNVKQKKIKKRLTRVMNPFTTYLKNASNAQ